MTKHTTDLKAHLDRLEARGVPYYRITRGERVLITAPDGIREYLRGWLVTWAV